MKYSKWLTRLTGLILMGAAWIAPDPARAQVFNPTTWTLPNGLQVVVVENHRAPIVTHMVWYKVGAADEPAGHSGIAHLLEHLMFKGTPTIPPGEFSKIIARQGGQDNAFTSNDYTAYFQNIAADRLDTVMRMEADRMRNLVLDDKNVSTELAVVQEERRSRTDNSPAALLNERVQAALYLNHPYRKPIIGWPSELAALTRQDALDFYRTWYSPNNAIVVVVGDVTPAQVRSLADKYYAPLKPEPALPPRKRAEEPPPAAGRVVTLQDARVRQPAWSRTYVAPSYAANGGDAARPYALEVLAEVLGGGATSRLYKSLAVDQGLAAQAGAWYDGGGLDGSSFVIAASPNPGVDMDKMEAAISSEITLALTQGISADEVTRAKARLRAGVAYARDTLDTAARVLGESLTTGQSVADVEAWPERIAAVTPDQVNAAARAILDDKASVTGILLPVPGQEAPANSVSVIAPAKDIR